MSGFDQANGNFAQGGGVLYGGSAGAMVLGKDISTCAWMDSNDVGLADTGGLALLGNYSVWCHYSGEHDDAIIRMEQLILAVPERSGVVFDGRDLMVVGFEPVAMFVDDSKHLVSPGDSVPAVSAG